MVSKLLFKKPLKKVWHKILPKFIWVSWPDSSDIYENETKLFLGFNRLSIIDLSNKEISHLKIKKPLSQVIVKFIILQIC